MTKSKTQSKAGRAGPTDTSSSRGEKTRQKIIDALFSLLETQPLRRITVSMIAREVGVTSQLFYNYFKSIDEVIEEEAVTLLDSRPPLVELVDCEWTDENALARAREVVEQVLEYWEHHRVAMRVVTLLGDSGHPSFVSFREMRGREFAAALARLVRRQIARGRLPASVSPELLGWTIVSSLQGMGLAYPDTIRQFSLDELVETHAYLLAAELGFRPSPDRQR